jgi:hypothetical protein
MNKYEAINVSYLRPSRTIETILLENGSKREILYVYNYDGVYFRVFNFIIDILNFFQNETETDAEVSFETDEELNNYLANLDLRTISSASPILI